MPERLPVARSWSVAALLALTFVTGLVDAVGYLRLGRVFVGNMTGNVLLLGFSAVPGHGLPVVSPVVSLVSFLLGAFGCGRLGGERVRGRRWFAALLAGHCVLLTLAAALLGEGVTGTRGRGTLAVVGLLAVCCGSQTAVARRLGIQGLTTTVITQTLTGIAADTPLGDGLGGKPLRILAIATLVAAAALGALLLQVTTAGVVGLATAVTALAAGLFLLAPAARTPVRPEEQPR